MGGGDVPDGFPRSNPTTSYWQLPPHAIAHYRSTPDLPTSTRFDYVVIGSGISGAAIAYKLLMKDSSLKILMLEARTAASGASGRNGGQCRAGWWLNFKKYAEAHGEEEALKFEVLEEQNVQDIADFVRDHQVECDFQDVETADACYTEDAWNEMTEVLQMREESYQKHGLKPMTQKVVRRGEEASKHLGFAGIVGCVTYPARTQNPYLLVCRMLELSLKLGLQLQTNTLALAIRCISSQQAHSWEVDTERGTVKAQRVVLATNGYTNALHSGIAETRFLNPSRSQLSAIRPSKGNLFNHPALHKSVALEDLNSGDYFLIRAPGLKGAGDVVYGGGRFISRPTTTDDTIVHDGVATYLHDIVPKVFGEQNWGEQSTKVRDWSGITCYTPDTFPLVGQVPDEEGLWASVGMNGHGMAMAFRSAEALVEMMTTGAEPEWFPKPFRIARAFQSSHDEIENSAP